MNAVLGFAFLFSTTKRANQVGDAEADMDLDLYRQILDPRLRRILCPIIQPQFIMQTHIK
ncbi:hypothetical protein glysoja_043779 [Glycine soja]|uniref:Uncharacterized protein n=1 Tax=Glycine soja TaxID=3848 RepID=A0A0B2R457_GLYSO|nr:hypothetical protein glysoja_043779 [Glycine soja]